MKIRARMSMSADGYVTTPAGWPSLVADPVFVPGPRVTVSASSSPPARRR
jgi:hypothetical protein